MTNTNNSHPNVFRALATRTSRVVGSPLAFLTALLIIVAWAVTGPMFGFSDTWQLAINTTTTVVTFLMVFLIQNTQNRDARAMHLKLDELVKTQKGARNSVVEVQEMTDEQLEEMQQEFRELHEKYTSELLKRRKKS